MDALLDVIEGLTTTIQNNETTNCSAVFLDLRKAFDTVDHQILLANYPGLRCVGIFFSIFLIKSYLTNRRQFILCGKTESGIEKIDFGVGKHR